jgi:hypothetical protein
MSQSNKQTPFVPVREGDTTWTFSPLAVSFHKKIKTWRIVQGREKALVHYLPIKAFVIFDIFAKVSFYASWAVTKGASELAPSRIEVKL